MTARREGATVRFTWDGRPLTARPGETLATALLANGVRLVGRSFKYHRPRGILGSGVEEPNALVTVGQGGRAEPNTRATDVFVYEGLVAKSQNRWPSLGFDVAAVTGVFARALPAGFYYKTFFGPAKLWLKYEALIRRAAGLGPAPQIPDPDAYSHRAAFTDVLVVGGGRAGLAAALDAARAGKRVMLVEQDASLGGGEDAALAELRAAGGTILSRATATGIWDHNLVVVAQRLAEPGQPPPPHGFAQRLWHVRAGKVVLATGLIERTIPFANNDLPGIMLSRAVRTYVTRYSVLPGRQALVLTNNSDAYATAAALVAAGATVTLLDTRAAPAAPADGFAVVTGAVPHTAHGGKHVAGLTAQVNGGEQRFAADLIVISGGFTPNVSLFVQAGGKLVWDEPSQALVPAEAPPNLIVTGSITAPPAAAPITPAGNPKRSFVDQQNDVTLADIDLAWAEGYRSVEHVKRYTTLGMATDQGKTGNMAALARLAENAGTAKPPATTTFRPPYTPVTMAVLAGSEAGGHVAPLRRLALDAVHDAAAPLWLNAGLWRRPRAYPLARVFSSQIDSSGDSDNPANQDSGETLATAALREARAVRRACGLTDVSTLSKFMVTGPDAAAFLERVCATRVANLAKGRGRYTFMLRDDGLVFDDGTVWRLGPDRYLLTASTGGAARMATHLAYVAHVLWPEARVSVADVQENFAAIAVAGPRSATVIEELTGVTPPRHMGAIEAMIAGAPTHLLAASFSGERAFEVHFPASHAPAVWAVLAAAVSAAGGAAYGLEAMDLLRIEKGHLVVGSDIDGRLTAGELGLAKMLNPQGGFVGAACLQRPAPDGPGRRQFVGLDAIDGGAIPEGAMLVRAAGHPAQGHVTSAGRRVLGEGAIALGHLIDGHARSGEVLVAYSPTRRCSASVRVCSPHFYDPAGALYRG